MKFRYKGHVLELTPEEVQQIKQDPIVVKVLSEFEWMTKRLVELIHTREKVLGEAATPFLEAKLRGAP